jgi:hypothetical protein
VELPSFPCDGALLPGPREGGRRRPVWPEELPSWFAPEVRCKRRGAAALGAVSLRAECQGGAAANSALKVIPAAGGFLLRSERLILWSCCAAAELGMTLRPAFRGTGGTAVRPEEDPLPRASSRPGLEVERSGSCSSAGTSCGGDGASCSANIAPLRSASVAKSMVSLSACLASGSEAIGLQGKP